MQVADDQRRPALREDLRPTGDGAVLAVRPHGASVARPRAGVKSRFLTSQAWGAGAQCGRRQRRTPMTATTSADIGVAGKRQTVAQIEGFRGRLVCAGDADYDIARAVW